jgi:hypothetical protein
MNNEQQIISDYNALRQVRRDNKKSIVKTDEGLFLISVVYTAPSFAQKIVDYFSPQFKKNDSFLDPCAGRDAFYDALPPNKNWCEIQRGRDFLQYNQKVNWVFANFPWRGKVYSELAKHSFELSDNVVSLVKFSTAIGTTKRFRDAENNQMKMKEIIFCSWDEAGFTFHDGSKKLKEGFILSIIHWQKNWDKGTLWSSWATK